MRGRGFGARTTSGAGTFSGFRNHKKRPVTKGSKRRRARRGTTVTVPRASTPPFPSSPSCQSVPKVGGPTKEPTPHERAEAETAHATDDRDLPGCRNPRVGRSLPGGSSVGGGEAQVRWHVPEGVPWLTSLVPVPRDPRPGRPGLGRDLSTAANDLAVGSPLPNRRASMPAEKRPFRRRRRQSVGRWTVAVLVPTIASAGRPMQACRLIL